MIVVTGANGFIGSHLVRALACRDKQVRAVVRSLLPEAAGLPGVQTTVVADVQTAEWEPILEGANAIVHLAGRAHVLGQASPDADHLYWATNVEGTQRLAEAAARAGVKRFIFISSSKAMGEATAPSGPWREESVCQPKDAYGRTKLAGERAVMTIATQSELTAVILRPPVVYGPRVRANILELFRLIDHGTPLPLGLVRNRRSLLYVGNLVDAIICTLEVGCASPALFLVSDGEDVSTPELARRIGRALGRQVRLLPVPPAFLKAGGRAGDLLERGLRRTVPLSSSNVTRLIESHVLDTTRIQTVLGWRPPHSLDAGLKHTAAWYREVLASTSKVGETVSLPPTLDVSEPTSCMSRETRSADARIYEPIFKRAFDLVLSSAGLLLSLPVWVLVAACIWVEDGRPILFLQPRIGRHGQLFRVLKFRSMIRDAGRVEVQAQKGDSRITRVGRILRRTSMDELPQLWNIFLGQMSFVGPRAQPEKERVKVRGIEEEVYIRDVPGYELRQLVRPGLTGITQIFAPREIPHRHKFKYDLIYVRKVVANALRPSLVGDLKMFAYDLALILRSVWITLRGRWEV